MKFEGTQVNIPIKGIMRAGTDNLCADGAMNEVIGMEYKDGSWLPYKTKDQKVRVQIWNEDDDAYEDLNNISKVYVHKSSNGSSRRLFLTADRILAYEVNNRTFQDYIIIETKALSYRVNSIKIVGNVVCIATDTGLEYYIWSELDGEYNTYAPKDMINSLPLVNFRVTSNPEGHPMQSEGYSGDVLYARSADITKYDTHSSGMWWDGDTAKEAKMMIGSTANKAQAAVASKGRFSGGFLVCAAYRLKGGGYIAASPVQLMNAPSIANSFDDSYGVYIPQCSLYPDGRHFRLGFRSNDGWSYEEVQVEHTSLVLNDIYGIKAGSEPGTVVHSGINSYYSMPSIFGYYHQIFHESGTGIDGPSDRGFYVVGCLSNALQYKIASSIPDSYKLLIDSLCIFVSNDVSLYKDFTEDNISLKTDFQFVLDNDTSDLVTTNSWFFAKRSNAQYAEKIKELKNLYLVHEIPFSSITQSSGWVTPDLEGRLGDVLMMQESLPISAINRDSIISGELDTYNRRLHIYNYTLKAFPGNVIKAFKYEEGIGQYATTSGAEVSYGYTSVHIKVTIRSQQGTSVVWRSTSLATYGLNPMLSYPNSDAVSMDIYYLNDLYSQGWWVRHFDLVPSSSGSYAYYLKPNLTPISIGDNTDTAGSPTQTSEPTPEELNAVTMYTNRMRVSDSDFVSYFPLEQTYVIGNMEVIKLASLSISLSQDTYGRFPLLAFCKDGIYSLGVDTTGSGAYTNITPFSREVCINKNTICEIDGAVVFASDKGLMVATQNGVEEFCPQLNGKIRFVPDDSGDNPKSGAAIYNKMITEQHIVKLSVNTVDFLDFLGEPETVVSYISKKNKVIVYNKQRRYVYIIDIPTRNATKLHTSIAFDDDNYPDEIYWQRPSELVSNEYVSKQFLYQSQDGYIDCLVQSRPIKIQQDDKCSYRVVITGYFEGQQDDWAELVVLGSLDAEHWRVIGVKEKKLNGGFHNLGCLTERGSWKYLTFIFAGRLSEESHIDSIDITANGKYNNKKR